MRRASIRPPLLSAVLAIAAVVLLTGCDTDTPSEQTDRQRKAAEVQTVELHMPKDVWTSTSTGAGHKPLEDPQALTEQPDGTVTVVLTGAQLVDYLQLLDFNAHGGFMAKDKSSAAAVYDALAPVLDAMAVPLPAGAPVPTVTVAAAGN